LHGPAPAPPGGRRADPAIAVGGLVRLAGALGGRRGAHPGGRAVSADAESPFLRAARRQPVERTPIWLMRQAGRSLPEYRKLRERWTLVDIVAQPELCAEVTLQPVRRLAVDAAVMFADIMLPLRGMGVEFELVESIGPVIAHPIASADDVARLRVPEGDEAAPRVIDAVRRVVADSPVPVICFSGAPFTLAGYLIEGRPSRTFARA